MYVLYLSLYHPFIPSGRRVPTQMITRPVAGRSRANFHPDVTNILRSWLEDNWDDPYPDAHEKRMLAEQTGLSVMQVG